MKKRLGLFNGLKDGQRGFVHKIGPAFRAEQEVASTLVEGSCAVVEDVVVTPVTPTPVVTVVTDDVVLPKFSFVKSMDEVYGKRGV